MCIRIRTLETKLWHNHLPSVPLILVAPQRPFPGVLVTCGPQLGLLEGQLRPQILQLLLAPCNLPPQVVDSFHRCAVLCLCMHSWRDSAPPNG